MTKLGITKHGAARFEVQGGGKRIAVFDDKADAELFITARNNGTDYNELHLKLREANNQIMDLEFELESLKQDAGAEIHDLMARYKVRLAALAEALRPFANIWESPEPRYPLIEDYKNASAALRQYGEAGNDS